MIIAFLFFSGLIGYEIGLEENYMYVDQTQRACFAQVEHEYDVGFDDCRNAWCHAALDGTLNSPITQQCINTEE